MVQSGQIIQNGQLVRIHVVYLATKGAQEHVQSTKFKDVSNPNFQVAAGLQWRKDHVTDTYHAQVEKFLICENARKD